MVIRFNQLKPGDFVITTQTQLMYLIISINDQNPICGFCLCARTTRIFRIVCYFPNAFVNDVMIIRDGRIISKNVEFRQAGISFASALFD